MTNTTLTTANTFAEYPNIVSSKQLQEMLGIGRNTTLNLLSSGEIRSIKIGKNYKVAKVWILDYLNKLTTN